MNYFHSGDDSGVRTYVDTINTVSFGIAGGGGAKFLEAGCSAGLAVRSDLKFGVEAYVGPALGGTSTASGGGVEAQLGLWWGHYRDHFPGDAVYVAVDLSKFVGLPVKSKGLGFGVSLAFQIRYNSRGPVFYFLGIVVSGVVGTGKEHGSISVSGGVSYTLTTHFLGEISAPVFRTIAREFGSDRQRPDRR